MYKNVHRLLSVDDEARRPSERAALELWLAHRPDVFRRALLEAERTPDFITQVVDVDRAMIDAFNAATAYEREQDVPYLMDRSVRLLTESWKPPPVRAPVDMAGALPLAELGGGTSRLLIVKTHLR